MRRECMRFIGVLTISLLMALPGWGQLQRLCPLGVLPTENITTAEVNPALNVLDDSAGISSTQLTFKTYRVINEHYNWGIELPLTRYESPEKSVSGLGDTSLSVTWMQPQSTQRLGYGVKLEFFAPTATDKRLGSGKLQASPSVFVVWQMKGGLYIAGGYKQYTSIVGDHAREDINYGRFRLNISYLSPTKWWIQTNAYYYQDYRHSAQAEFIPELELGTLINEGTAFYINGSTHAGGNWHSKDWSLGVGFKVLYL